MDQVACGAGVVNTSRPQTGDNEVIKQGDTSDPGADCTYGTGDDCPSPTCKACTPPGQGSDTKGKIVRAVGNGSADVSGVHFRLPTPMLATVWQDTQNPCPDGSTFDDGESLIAQLVLNAEPSSAGATGSFTDLNTDGCKHAGAGFSTASPDGPIAVGTSVARPQSYDGSVGAIQVAADPSSRAPHRSTTSASSRSSRPARRRSSPRRPAAASRFRGVRSRRQLVTGGALRPFRDSALAKVGRPTPAKKA